MTSAVVSARLAGLDRIKSGFTSRFASRLPIFGASRLPRSSNGRSLSGNAVSSQLDFAWRMRNSLFMQHPVRPGRPVPTYHPARAHRLGAQLDTATSIESSEMPSAPRSARWQPDIKKSPFSLGTNEFLGSWAADAADPFGLVIARKGTRQDLAIAQHRCRRAWLSDSNHQKVRS